MSRLFLSVFLFTPAIFSAVDESFIGQRLGGNLPPHKIPGVSQRSAILLKRAQPPITKVLDKLNAGQPSVGQVLRVGPGRNFSQWLSGLSFRGKKTFRDDDEITTVIENMEPWTAVRPGVCESADPANMEPTELTDPEIAAVLDSGVDEVADLFEQNIHAKQCENNGVDLEQVVKGIYEGCGRVQGCFVEELMDACNISNQDVVERAFKIVDLMLNEGDH